MNKNNKIIYFSDKFDNLHGCPIRVVTFQRCPAMCYNRTTRRFSGYDYEVIQTLEEILNFQINMTFLVGTEQWGTILPNGTTTEGLNVLRNGSADVAIGNYILRLSRLKYFDSTVSYYSIPIVLVIPPRKIEIFSFDYFSWSVLIPLQLKNIHPSKSFCVHSGK